MYNVFDVKPSSDSAVLAWHRAQANGSWSLGEKLCYSFYPVLAYEASVVFTHRHLCFAPQCDADMTYMILLVLEASS